MGERERTRTRACVRVRACVCVRVCVRVCVCVWGGGLDGALLRTSFNPPCVSRSKEANTPKNPLRWSRLLLYCEAETMRLCRNKPSRYGSNCRCANFTPAHTGQANSGSTVEPHLSRGLRNVLIKVNVYVSRFKGGRSVPNLSWLSCRAAEGRRGGGAMALIAT
jgi:hypothetical protein